MYCGKSTCNPLTENKLLNTYSESSDVFCHVPAFLILSHVLKKKKKVAKFQFKNR